MTVSARALRAKKPGFERGGRWQAMRTMIAQFASHEVSGLEVTLEAVAPGGTAHRFQAITDSEGFAHFEVELEDWPLPDNPAWDVVAFHWANRDGDQCVEGHVLAPGADTRVAVISDIDDTIIETGITGDIRSVLRNWRRVLAQMPEDRLQVPGADVFYSALGGSTVRTASPPEIGSTVPAMTERPFFYVSSSPWNLYSYLVAYKRGRNLPLGPIALKDWGLHRDTFGSSSHGAHKRAAIDRILSAFPGMRFALIGDDTQGDLTAYGAVVSDNPGRIAAVFIRTAGAQMTPEEIAAEAGIRAVGVPIWLGSDYHSREAFLHASGLASDSNAAQIIKVIDDTSKDVS